MQPDIHRISGRPGARGLGAAVVLAAILALLLSTTTAFATPTVIGVSPVSGGVGTPLTVTGTLFESGNATSLRFVGAANPFPGIIVPTTFVSAGSVTLLAPSGLVGAQTITVITAVGGESSTTTTFTYTSGGAGTPVISSFTPTSGSTSGGTAVTVYGSNFTGAFSVAVGGTAVAFSPVGDTQLSIPSTPAHVAGSFPITVQNSAGVGTSSQLFTYTSGASSIPVISFLSPTTGPTTGGNSVIISGSGLVGATAVQFGSGLFGTIIAPALFEGGTMTVTAPAHAAGSVYVQVTNGFGTSVQSAGSLYTYGTSGTGIPVISTMSPTSGPITGGTQVTLTGSNLNAVTSVSFGGFPATGLIHTSDASLTVTAPAHAAGQVVVTATSVYGTGTAVSYYTYGGSGTGVGPTVYSFSPNVVPISGGTITFSGVGFSTVTSVSFGGTFASVIPSTDNSFTAFAPAHAAGPVAVTVTNASGTTTAPDVLVYGNRYGPVINTINPTTGPTTGLNTVTLFGSGFTGATMVTFGGTVAGSVNVIGDSQLTTTAPAHAAGGVNITVTAPLAGQPGVMGTGVSTTQYTYTGSSGAVSITSISPATGPTAGGTSVTITGSGFGSSGQSQVVYFGSAAGTITSINDSTIVVTTPAGTGSVQVIVYAPSGNATSPTNFTYGSTLPVITSVTPSSGPTGTNITITGTGFTGATSVTFDGVAGTGMSVSGDTVIYVTAPTHAPGAASLIVTGPNGSSTTSSAGTFTFTGGTLTYTLNFRWSLIVWTGRDGISAISALKGQISGATGLNDISSQVTAIFRWNGGLQKWEAYFPGTESTPGANDFTTLTKNGAYWIAISSSGSVTWTTVQG